MGQRGIGDLAGWTGGQVASCDLTRLGLCIVVKGLGDGGKARGHLRSASEGLRDGLPTRVIVELDAHVAVAVVELASALTGASIGGEEGGEGGVERQDKSRR